MRKRTGWLESAMYEPGSIWDSFGKLMMLLAVISLIGSGCTMVSDVGRDRAEEVDRMSRELSIVVVDQWEVIEPFIGEGISGEMRSGPISIDPEMVVSNMLDEYDEDVGYLRFFHAAAVAADPDLVLETARALVPEDLYAQLVERSESARSVIIRESAEASRTLSDEDRPAFMKDMQQLITRTIVLLAASAVYACMPTVMFWGKISAAAAVSVATGAVAVTVMSIYRYYQYGGEVSTSFEEWLKAVSTEPQASYALAASVISVGTSMELNPVCCGLILAVFSIYQAVDMLKTIMEVYEI